MTPYVPLCDPLTTSQPKIWGGCDTPQDWRLCTLTTTAGCAGTFFDPENTVTTPDECYGLQYLQAFLYCLSAAKFRKYFSKASVQECVGLRWGTKQSTSDRLPEFITKRLLLTTSSSSSWSSSWTSTSSWLAWSSWSPWSSTSSSSSSSLSLLLFESP